MKNFIIGLVLGLVIATGSVFAYESEFQRKYDADQQQQQLNRIEQNQIYNEVSKDRISAGIGLPESPCK